MASLVTATDAAVLPPPLSSSSSSSRPSPKGPLGLSLSLRPSRLPSLGYGRSCVARPARSLVARARWAREGAEGEVDRSDPWQGKRAAGGRQQKDRGELFDSMPSAREVQRMQSGRGRSNGDSQAGGRGRGRGRGSGRSASRGQPAWDDDGELRAKPQASGGIPLLRVNDDRTAATTDFYSDDSWKTAGASPQVVDAVKSLGFSRPSHVQADAFKEIKACRSHVVIADRAGSGKTLAYLVPLIQALKEEERDGTVDPSKSEPNRPRFIVLAPTEELVQQVRRVVQGLSQAGLPLRNAILTGGHNYRSQKEMLASGPDVVIATPERLLKHYEDGHLLMNRCKAIVLDEVDVLLADTASFRDQVVQLRQVAPKSLHFVMVTATLPHSVYLELMEEFPFLEVFQGPGLHRNPPGITEQLVDCSGGTEVSVESGFERKTTALLRLLKTNAAERSIIFCNKIDTCRQIENLLNRNKDVTHKVLPYHAALSDKMRQGFLEEFLAAPDGELPKVLVCTDRASRGVDSAFVEHVVLFDFPRDPSEYVRRVGRTARGAGGQGTVTSLVLGRQVGLAQNIINRNQRGVPIHKIPSI